ncbi:hypothetical protein PC112_g8506 [Phytophthora cactorum]|nr:hypothetical protein PC112_g8506 [Phytophthora cactorum]
MSLNCFSSRAAVETESELEAASKLVERAFNRIQKSDSKRDRVQQAIKDTRAGKTQEMESHLEEKRMRLKERTA